MPMSTVSATAFPSTITGERPQPTIAPVMPRAARCSARMRSGMPIVQRTPSEVSPASSPTSVRPPANCCWSVLAQRWPRLDALMGAMDTAWRVDQLIDAPHRRVLRALVQRFRKNYEHVPPRRTHELVGILSRHARCVPVRLRRTGTQYTCVSAISGTGCRARRPMPQPDG
jgi:hypothetical protein